jgi:hypothetical protein
MHFLPFLVFEVSTKSMASKKALPFFSANFQNHSRIERKRSKTSSNDILSKIQA